MDIKKATDTEKKRVYDNNKNLADDLANNNGHPICHTRNGNKKALSYSNQALCICKGFESLRAKNDTERYHKQLLYTGYVWKTEREATNESYLSNLEKNVTDIGNIFKCINSLSVNPLQASFETILGAHQKPGRKVTDLGKTSRVYSSHEANTIIEYQSRNNHKRQDSSNSNSNSSSNSKSNDNSNIAVISHGNVDNNSHDTDNNENDNVESRTAELTNEIHFDCIEIAVKEMSKLIKHSLKLPSKENCNNGKSYKKMYILQVNLYLVNHFI